MQTLLARLKGETRLQHLRLEQDLGVMRDDLTREWHRALVRRLYGFYRPWESTAIPVLETGHPGLTCGRAKVPLLVRDLERLGDPAADRERLPICQALPRLDTLPLALGSMYVLEGATLGGQVVSRHLGRTLGIDAETGAAFFQSYGAETGPMWRRFGDALAAHAGAGADDAIVASATDTFLRMHAWLVDADGSRA